MKISTIITRKIIFTIVAILVLLAFWWILNWHNQSVTPAPIPATESPALKGSPVEKIIPAKPMKVRSGEKVKRKLRLAEADVVNPDVSVIAASRVEPDFYPVDVITKIDKSTGETETVVVRQPLPWLALTTRGDVMLAGGLNTSGDQVGMVQVRQGLLQIKSVTIGIVGQASHTNSAGGHTDAAGMAAIWYGWGR